MLRRNHLIIAGLLVLFSLAFIQLPLIYTPLVLMAFVGAAMPDLDYSFGTHRRTFHNVWAVALIAGYMYYYHFPPYATEFFLLGYVSHLIADMFTVEGVAPFHPFSEWKINGFITTGSTMENIFVVIIALVLVAIYAYVGGFIWSQ